MNHEALPLLLKSLKDFDQERDWEQFHTVKNLIMALTGEVGELCEIFQWIPESECLALMAKQEKNHAIKDELADIFIYLIRIASRLDIDLVAVAHDKLEKNKAKYPVELCRGSSKKYNEY